MPRPHPLARLRALSGDTQLSYARLVAETHEALGFGKLHARREKVSRWESQSVPPDQSTQLAIAHIHQVSEADVQLLRWPEWLHLGSAAAPRAVRTHAREETLDKVLDRERKSLRPVGLPLRVTGQALVSFVRETLHHVADPPSATSDGQPVAPETVALVEERSASLYTLVSSTNPVILHRLARAEHELITALLDDGGYDRTTGARLLLARSHVAHLCGFLSKSLGEDVRAERYYRAAVRAAARAGSRLTTSACLADLAWSHVEAGDPADVETLVRAARTVTRDRPARLELVLHSREARAHARRGELIASARAMDRAAETLATSTAGKNAALHGNVDDEWVSIAMARTWLDARQPKRALDHFAVLLADDRRPSGAGVAVQPPVLVARDLLAVVDAQLALRDVTSAARSASRVVSLFDRAPSAVIAQYRRRFLPHAETPAAREVMGLLAEARAI